MRSAVKTGAVHHVGDLADGDQVVHRSPVLGVIFEIGILDDNDVAAHSGKSGLESSALASIAFMIDWPDRHARGRHRGYENEIAARIDFDGGTRSCSIWNIRLEPLASAVLRAVLDNDNLLGHRGQCLAYCGKNRS